MFKRWTLDTAINFFIFLLILLPPLFFSFQTISSFRLPKLILSLQLILIIVFLYLVKIIILQQIPFTFTPLIGQSVLFICLCAISTFLSKFFYISYYTLFCILVYFLLFFTLTNIKVQIANILNFFYIMIFTATFISIYVLLQYKKIDPVFNLGGEIQGFHGNSADFASCVVSVIIINIALLFYPNHILSKTTLFITTLIITASLYLSACRSAIIALIISLIMFTTFYLFLNRKNAFVYNLLLVFLILLSITATGMLTWFFIIQKNPVLFAKYMNLDSLHARLTIWRDTMPMFKEHLLFGHGPGIYKTLSCKYQSWLRLEVAQAHNEYIQLLAEVGILGLTAAIILLLSFFYLVASNTNKIKNSQYKILIIGSFCGVLAQLINSIFFFPFHIASSTVYTTMFAAFIFLIYKTDSENIKKKCKNDYVKISIVVKIILFAVISLVFGFASWQIWIPYRAEIYAKNGVIAAEKKNRSEVLRNFKTACKLDKWNGQACGLYGSALAFEGKYNEAKKELFRVLEFRDYGALHAALGYIYLKEGLLENAQKEYLKSHQRGLNAEFLRRE